MGGGSIAGLVRKNQANKIELFGSRSSVKHENKVEYSAQAECSDLVMNDEQRVQ